MYEKEADSVADRIMQTPEEDVQLETADDELQTKPEAGATIQRETADEDGPEAESSVLSAERDDPAERDAAADHPSGEQASTPLDRIRALLGSGKPLDAALRRTMERSFGSSFRNVRMLDPAQASNLAKIPGARVFTLKTDLVVEKSEDDGPKAESSVLSAKRDDPAEQNAAADHASGGQASPTLDRIRALRGYGKPLDATVRRTMERRFGRSFRHVQVHDSAQASNLAKSLGARAFTLGNDIFFKTTKYKPNASAGRRLIAHELVHVLQQTPHQAVPTGQAYSVKPGGQRPVRTLLATPSIQRDLDPPGDCLQGVHEKMQRLVKAWCDHFGGRTCEPHDSCARIKQKMRRNQLCYQHRTAINTKCYRGGNKGHRDAARDASKAQRNCQITYNAKCRRRPKPPPPGPSWDRLRRYLQRRKPRAGMRPSPMSPPFKPVPVSARRFRYRPRAPMAPPVCDARCRRLQAQAVGTAAVIVAGAIVLLLILSPLPP